MVSGVVLILIGIPGSGKTTFSNNFVQECKFSEWKVCPVCFDKILNDRIFWDQPLYSWKAERRFLLDSLRHLISEPNANIPPRGIPESFWQIFCDTSELKQLNMNRKICILIDDNMYYRSMRLPYYQLARKFGLGYCQLFFDCKLEQAEQRNSKRNRLEFVPETVLRRMAEKLEPPDPLKYFWEKYSLTLSGGELVNFSEILELIQTAYENLPEPLPNSQELRAEKEQDRKITRENLVHRLDLILRKGIADIFSNRSRILSQNDTNSEYGKRLSAAKNEILARFKTGELECDDPESEKDKFIEILIEISKR